MGEESTRTTGAVWVAFDFDFDKRLWRSWLGELWWFPMVHNAREVARPLGGARLNAISRTTLRSSTDY